MARKFHRNSGSSTMHNFSIHDVESVTVEPVESVDIGGGIVRKAIWRKLLVMDTDGHKTEIIFFANDVEKLVLGTRFGKVPYL